MTGPSRRVGRPGPTSPWRSRRPGRREERRAGRGDVLRDRPVGDSTTGKTPRVRLRAGDVCEGQSLILKTPLLGLLSTCTSSRVRSRRLCREVWQIRAVWKVGSLEDGESQPDPLDRTTALGYPGRSTSGVSFQATKCLVHCAHPHVGTILVITLMVAPRF